MRLYGQKSPARKGNRKTGATVGIRDAGSIIAPGAGSGARRDPEFLSIAETRTGERKAEPVVSKGITLRPANVDKLDRLELSLRKQGIKAGHSGLIQIAIEHLEDNAQLAAAYRELLKQDLRLK